MHRRVVVTGAGCVTPLGATVDRLWQGLTAGQSGIAPVSLFDASQFPVRIAAEVRDWDLSRVGEDPRRWRNCPRQTHFALGAGIQAVEGSGIDSARLDRTRFGVYLGCGESFQDLWQLAELIGGQHASPETPEHTGEYVERALRIFRPDVELEHEPNMPAFHLAAMYDAQGPNLNCIAACASSTQAIGEASELIRRGTVDVMLAGGSHSMIHPLGVAGFHRLAALSTRNDDPCGALRPFDRDREGFVIGEGGAMFVLEELQHALARGAEIWGEVTGYGSAQDAYRITDSHPDGRGAASSIQAALDDAGLNPDQIDYINAHGTGTVINDKVETLAIKRVLGDYAWHVPISSTKSMLGHFTTASGAIEMLVSLLAIRHGVVPPTINCDNRDPECDLDYVPHSAREVSCQHVLSNSFGLGGQNAALVLSRFERRQPGAVRRLAA